MNIVNGEQRRNQIHPAPAPRRTFSEAILLRIGNFILFINHAMWTIVGWSYDFGSALACLCCILLSLIIGYGIAVAIGVAISIEIYGKCCSCQNTANISSTSALITTTTTQLFTTTP